jgi:hypothetical protein
MITIAVTDIWVPASINYLFFRHPRACCHHAVAIIPPKRTPQG